MFQNSALLDNPQKASQWLEKYHRQNKSIGFVPTMGALHEGHLSLVRTAKQQNDIVIASIFVNPLQFNNDEDLKNYPRNLDDDRSVLEENGTSMIFTGTLESFFPDTENTNEITLKEPGYYAQSLEGEYRPGHFEGVRTIVQRLFEIVGHCKAYFGEKDFQQTLVVKDLARQMGYPQIIVCPTIREANGLAMSSRNQRLDDQQRQIAARIFQALANASKAWHHGTRDAGSLTQLLIETLNHEQIEIEYAQLRDPENWSIQALHGPLKTPPQALIAVKIGDVRLIDNANLGNELSLNNEQ